MRNPWVQITRYGVVAIIWCGVFTFAILLALSSASMLSETVLIFGGVGFISAAISTLAILTHDSSRTDTTRQTAKLKNGDAVDPMSLLSDADIAELREEYKDLLRRRMYEEDGEESFENLLSAAPRKRG